MKKYICILASAALLVACEQKTETAAPAASPAETTESATTPATSTETTTMPAEHCGRIDSDGDHDSGYYRRQHHGNDDDRSLADSVIQA